MSIDNPAGRLLEALTAVRQLNTNDSAQAKWCESWELDAADPADVAECLRRGYLMMQLAFETRRLAGTLKPSLVERNLSRLDQVEAALTYFTVLPSVTLGQMLDPIKPDGWLALENLDGVLSETLPEPVLLDEPLSDLLAATRALIDQVKADDDLSDEAKRHIVDQLREVERALIDFRMTGAGPVDTAASGLAGILTRLHARGESVAKKPITTAIFALVLSLDVGLNIAANYDGLTSDPVIIQLVENPQDLRPAIEPPAPPTVEPPKD